MTGKQTVETIVCGDYVVTMNDERNVITQGAVAIDTGEIVSVGSIKDIERNFQSRQLVDGTDQIVMPGLINGHTHAAMCLLRGFADDIPLMEWLQDYINPIEAHAVSEDYVRVGTQLACWEMLSGGTTTFVDMYFFHETAAIAVEEIGMRALISASMMDQPRNDAVDIDDSFKQAEHFVRDWSRRCATVVPIVAGHAIYTLKNEHLVRLRDLAKSLDVPVHIHLSESQFELDFSRDSYGTTPITHFERIGLLDVPVIAAHVVWPERDEIEILARKGVGVVHNPTCNARIASGTAPIVDLLECGVTVGLGTDGAASSNNLDMWEEMRVASLMQRAQTLDSTVLPAREILKMATSHGAVAIGMQQSIGKLVTGMRADVIQVSIDNAHHLPLYDVESHLAYSSGSRDVSNVFVDGKHLVRGRTPTTIDTNKLKLGIQRNRERITSFDSLNA